MANTTPPTPGDLIARLAALREQLKDANARVADLSRERDELQLQLIGVLDTQGATRMSTGEFTASVTETVVPTVKDWDAFYAFIKENDALFMLERRPLATAYREMLDTRDGEAIPGVESFTKRSISLRSR